MGRNSPVWGARFLPAPRRSSPDKVTFLNALSLPKDQELLDNEVSAMLMFATQAILMPSTG
jgi:hypothetical protein